MNVDQVAATKVAELSFARGKVGQRYPLVGEEAERRHSRGLADHTVGITKPNTADCGDDRGTIRLADGTEDPMVLRNRVTAQLFGGLGLATTKALVAANANIIKDAKNFWQAFETTSSYLYERGEEDGGHAGCGASGMVEASVSNPIPTTSLVPAIGLFLPMNERSVALVGRNTETKRQHLQDGFFGGWDPAKHEDYLATRFPQNFSYLADDPNDHETRGHNGSSLYVVTADNHGFAKNAFIEDTGQAALSTTLPKMHQLASILGGSPEERMRILIGFVDDSLHVGAGIVTEGMPVFAEQARD